MTDGSSSQTVSPAGQRSVDVRLRALADSVPALVSIIDRSFVYRFVNRAYTAWFGWPAESVVNRSMTDVLGDEAFAIIRPKLEAALAGETVRYEATLPYKRGGPRHVLITYSPDRASSGEVDGIFALVEDLSASRTVEQALADSERALRASGVQFEAFFSLPSVGKALADPATGRILRANAKLCAITGYTEAELTGTPLADLTHAGDAEGGRAMLAALAGGVSAEYQAERPFTRKDGTPVWLRVDASLLRDEHGRPQKTIAAIRDITVEKLGQEALRRREQSQRLLLALQDATRGQREPERVLREYVRLVAGHFRAARCVYGEVDDDGRTVSILVDHHDGVPSIAGQHDLAPYGPALIEQLRAARTVAVDDVAADPRTSADAPAYRAIDAGAFLAVPLVKDARLAALIAIAQASPRAWSDDDVALMELVAERTWFAIESARAEITLREHRDVMALAMRGGRMGAWSLDVATSRVWWSRELEEIVGLAPGGFQGNEEDFLALVHDQDRAALTAAVAAALESRDDYAVEFRFRHASGEWRWMEGRGRAVCDSGGRPVMLYGIGIDITERRRAEEELRRLNAELSDADRRKDDFIAMLAHELRNPLAPIRFSAEVLRLLGSAQPELTEARATIERQVQQMAKLLDDLMDVARVSRGKLQIQRAPMLLNDALLMAVETSRPLLDLHGHRLTIDLPETDVPVVGDGARLTQVFANLLNNAARYTPPGGEVRLTARTTDQTAEIVVADTGIGLEPDQLGPIFNAFAQVSQEGQAGGLGLGLALARAIILLHGGTVEAQSDGPGRGSRFLVTLPLARARHGGAGAQRAGQQPGVSHRVLVVDDNRDAADAMARMLELDGHKVETAYDGASALASAAARPPDVALLDIGLPDVSGCEVARQLRQGQAGPLTIVAISGWGQQRDKQQAIDAGCDVHLTKPADPRQVREIVAAVPARGHTTHWTGPCRP